MAMVCLPATRAALLSLLKVFHRATSPCALPANRDALGCLLLKVMMSLAALQVSVTLILLHGSCFQQSIWGTILCLLVTNFSRDRDHCSASSKDILEKKGEIAVGLSVSQSIKKFK